MINVFTKLQLKDLKKDFKKYGWIMPSYVRACMVLAIAEKEGVIADSKSV